MVSDADDFDPTAEDVAPLMQPVTNAMIGTAAAGFRKIRVELRPHELIKLIGYDPRGLQTFKKGSQVIEPSKHVSADLVELQQEVQRSIDQEKVGEMVEYLRAAVSNKKYADWAELDVVTRTRPDTSKWNAEHVVLLPLSAEYFIIDGQHRFCALIDFVRSYPELAKKFTQGVAISVIEEENLREWAGQGFHDKNYLRTAVKVTKALAADSRDPHNRLTKALHKHEVIIAGGGVNEQKDSLASASREMVTHAVLYKFVRGFCEGRRGLYKGKVTKPNLTEATFDEYEKRLGEYVDELSELLPTWTNADKRGDYLFRASPAWQALGVIGNLLSDIDDPDERHAVLSKVGEAKLDWRRSNVSWESIIGIKTEEKDSDGKVLKAWISPRASRQAIDGTIGHLKQLTGLGQEAETAEEEAE